MSSEVTAPRIADLHCHYPMHVLAGDDRPPLRNALRGAGDGSRLRTAIMWVANRVGNYRSWDAGPRVTLDLLQAGTAELVLSVLYSPFSEIDLDQRYGAPPQSRYPRDLFEQIRRVEEDLERVDPSRGRHLVVRTTADLDAAVASGRIAFVHCVEGGFHLGATADEVRATVRRLADRGVGYVTLAHLFWRRVATNAPALPFFSDRVYNLIFPQHTDTPLSPLGAAAAEEMYRRYVLIDIAHMRGDAVDATFSLVERLDAETGTSPQDHPIIATHVGVRTPRGKQAYNLSRDIVERIAARGGVMGVIMAQHQLDDGIRRRRTRTFDESFEVIAHHLDALREWTGSHDYSALGTDLDGFIKPTMAGIDTARDLALLRPALARRYGAPAAEQILWGNAHRVIRASLAARDAHAPPTPS